MEKIKIIRNVISKELTLFLHEYLILKKQVYIFLLDNNIVQPKKEFFGTFEDYQVPNTYSIYSATAFETLLNKIQPILEKKLKIKLVPNYSYARLYKKNDNLKRHIDRKSCEISITLNLGGDEWPIYIDETGGKNNKGRKIILNPGDLVVYPGDKFEHWRLPFKGKICSQVFLHYNTKTKNNIYDGREHLGIPNIKDIKAYE
tara:strand:- start:1596 stop:2201 length:606 start_codon:yes stop_codon:yes gene_type:complete